MLKEMLVTDPSKMVALYLIFVTTFLLFYWSWTRSKHFKFVRRVNKIPGLPTVPVFGNAFDFIGDPVEIFDWIVRQTAYLGPVIRLWFLNKALVVIRGARDAEHVLKSTTHTTKSENYRFFQPWTEQSIFTANGERWRKIRKILTPGFNYNVLHEFVPVFVSHAKIMANLLADEAKSLNTFDITPYCMACSFDIICESSMGTKVNAQLNRNAIYVECTVRILNIIMERYYSPWLRFDIFWIFSKSKRLMDQDLRYMNQFADQVIAERRDYNKSITSMKNINKSENDIGVKKRQLAFLDILLASEETMSLSHADIRNNVNFLVAAGFDTVASSMAWTLFLLGTYPKMQDRVVDELVEVFGDTGRVSDVTDLANLKFLERCVKESLRLYPSVPFFERAVQEDIHLEHYVIPAGCTVAFNTFTLHHDPEFFPEPEKFDPDRFLPENSQRRHPYAFIPFSAGPRNCIGLKYAMMEQKAILSTILRRYRIEAITKREDIKLQAGIVLRTVDGLKIRIYERSSHPKLRIHTD